jgi:nitrogen fixation protein FixH
MEGAVRKKSLIPWIFVGFMAIVVLVNAGMVTAALSTYSGLAHRDAFGRGVAYNRVIENVERQERLGWKVDLHLGEARAEGIQSLAVSLRDASGSALGGARITATLRRPVENVAPVEITFDEQAIGSYAGGPVALRRGQWDARVVVERAGERYDHVQRLIVR